MEESAVSALGYGTRLDGYVIFAMVTDYAIEHHG